MRKYIPELMPLIVEALLDGAAAMKREVAVTTLGQVVQSTGYESCGSVCCILFTLNSFQAYMCLLKFIQENQFGNKTKTNPNLGKSPAYKFS